MISTLQHHKQDLATSRTALNSPCWFSTVERPAAAHLLLSYFLKQHSASQQAYPTTTRMARGACRGCGPCDGRSHAKILPLPLHQRPRKGGGRSHAESTAPCPPPSVTEPRLRALRAQARSTPLSSRPGLCSSQLAKEGANSTGSHERRKPNARLPMLFMLRVVACPRGESM